MPTLRDRTSTSSAAIAGMSQSETTARRGSSKTSAFIRQIPPSLVDQDLDLVRGTRGETGEGIRCSVQVDLTRHHTLDREIPRSDLRGDAIEVVRMAGTLDRHVDSEPVAFLPEERRDVDRGWFQNSGPTESLRALAACGI